MIRTLALVAALGVCAPAIAASEAAELAESRRRDRCPALHRAPEHGVVRPYVVELLA